MIMKRGIVTALAAMAGLGLGTPAFAEDVTIAVVGPMTGQYASFGKQFKDGIEMAVADINAAGGVMGKTLKLEIGDDACEPKQATSVASKMAGQKVALIIGHYCSGSSIPASKIYAEEGIVQISPASTNPKFTDERAGPSIYRVCGRDDQQGAVAGAYMAKQLAGKKVAFVNDKSAYGKGLMEETLKAYQAAGGKEVLVEAYTPGEKDYTAIVSKIKQANADVIYVGGYHTEAGLILRQMRDQGLKTKLVAGDAMATLEFWSITGAAGEGTLHTFSPDARKTAAAAALVKKFRDAKIEPEGYVLYTYAAMQTWKQAVEAAKSMKSADVIKAMNEGTFKTVIGDFKFDKKGDPNLPPYAFYEWKNGTYDQIN